MLLPIKDIIIDDITITKNTAMIIQNACCSFFNFIPPFSFVEFKYLFSFLCTYYIFYFNYWQYFLNKMLKIAYILFLPCTFFITLNKLY